MKHILIIILSLFLLVGMVQKPILAADTAILKFEQGAYSATNGSTFDVSIVIDPATYSVVGSDVYVLYDTSKLQPVSVAPGTYFTTVTNNLQYGAGKLYISGSANDQASAKTGVGTIATVTFKVIADGSSTLSFDCTSTIIQAAFNAPNVMTCAQNGTTTVTSGTSGGATAAPTSGAPARSQLPRTGFFDDLRVWSLAGVALVVIGTSLRLLL